MVTHAAAATASIAGTSINFFIFGLSLYSIHRWCAAFRDLGQLAHQPRPAYLTSVTDDIDARQAAAFHDVVAAQLVAAGGPGPAHRAGAILQHAAYADPLVRE